MRRLFGLFSAYFLNRLLSVLKRFYTKHYTPNQAKSILAMEIWLSMKNYTKPNLLNRLPPECCLRPHLIRVCVYLLLRTDFKSHDLPHMGIRFNLILGVFDEVLRKEDAILFKEKDEA